jgi:hypothetical protein
MPKISTPHVSIRVMKWYCVEISGIIDFPQKKLLQFLVVFGLENTVSFVGHSQLLWGDLHF